MSIVRCRTKDCPHYTREGLRNDHIEYGADGAFCWRCRQRDKRQDEQARKRREKRR